MLRCADTARVPPARGVIVNAVEFPEGLRTVKTEFTTVVVTNAILLLYIIKFYLSSPF